MRVIVFLASLFLMNCTSETVFNPVGSYDLATEGIRTVESGTLEVGGEDGDYYGILKFTGTRDRAYTVGLEFASQDSMSFYLSGNGYLHIARQDTSWFGEFKYFGLNGAVTANKSGPLSDSTSQVFEQISALKPVGQGIISTPVQETFPSFDPNRNELFFTRDNLIVSSTILGTDWSEPQPVSFTGEFSDSAPYLTAEGNVMIFTSERPASGATESMRKNIWKVERDENGDWQEPTVYPEPVNIDSLGEYHAGIAANSSLYFVSYNRDGGFGRSDLYRASETNSGYQVDNLGPTINTDFSEADVYIDPEERFLLFISTSRDDSYGADDIYISRNENGTWTEPENLGSAVNSFAYEYGPWIDPVNKHFYFNSARRGSADIYRVNIDDIPLLNSYFK